MNNDWSWRKGAQPYHALIYAKETRKPGRSKEPDGRLAASSNTGITNHLQRIKREQAEAIEDAIPFIVDQLQREGLQHGWTMPVERYGIISRLALEIWMGLKISQADKCKALGVAPSTYKENYKYKIELALYYLRIMDDQ